MDQPIVSNPMDFNHTDGNAVDFTKTFDLTGNNNDQMLKFYLRKAGLSDDIRYLTSEQRRAFIYDIVKSNKNPGYWKPSVLPQTPTPTRNHFETTPNQRESTITMESIDDIPPASMTFDFAKYTQVKNPNSNQNKAQTKYSAEKKEIAQGSLYERQFSQQQSISNSIIYAPPNPPPSVSTLVTRKGRRIEVSGPTNFQHIAGDITRDRTKNAFDLSGTLNNNLLKKYMIERGITEEDVSGLDRNDLIRRIVQSEYTWMPIQTQQMERVVPPPPSEKYMAAVPTPPPSSLNKNNNISKGGALIVAPPVLPSAVASSSENIYEEIVPIKRNTTSIRRHRHKPHAPPPPIPVAAKKVSSVEHVNQGTPPPQPLANQNSSNLKQLANNSASEISTASPPPPPPPPPPHLSPKASKEDRYLQNSISMSIEKAPQLSIPPPKTYGGGPPPPPPPPPPLAETVVQIKQNEPKPKSQIKLGEGPPPPPPPPPSAETSVLSKQTESKPNYQAKSGGGPPPPPPPLPIAETAVHSKPNEAKPKIQIKPTETGGDPKDAFLESIRSGVTLKKVSQNKKPKHNVTAPGSSMTKQKQQLKGPQGPIGTDAPVQQEKPDFMAELRNATLKRIKKLENNPYASESEC